MPKIVKFGLCRGGFNGYLRMVGLVAAVTIRDVALVLNHPRLALRCRLGGYPFVRHHDAAGNGVAIFVFAEGDGPLRERNLDSQFVKAVLQAAVEFPLQAPLCSEIGRASCRERVL